MFDSLYNLNRYIDNMLRKAFATAQIYDARKEIEDINKRIQEMAINFDALQAEVTRTQTVHASAVALIEKVTAELETISADLAAKANEVTDTTALDNLVAELKSSTDALASAIDDSWDSKETHEEVLNADNPEAPTVSVVMPEVLPEEVTVSAEVLVDAVDVASEEPQAVIVLEESPEVVDESAPTVDFVVETEEGLTDVSVSVPEEVVTALEAVGVNVEEAVKEAYAAADEVTAEPLLLEAPAEEVIVDVVVEEVPADVVVEEAAVEVLEEAAPVEVVEEAPAEEAAPVEETPPTEEEPPAQPQGF